MDGSVRSAPGSGVGTSHARAVSPTPSLTSEKTLTETEQQVIKMMIPPFLILFLSQENIKVILYKIYIFFNNEFKNPI